jgi:Fibronectin type III domain
MANTQQIARAHRKNSSSAMSWLLQVGATAFICLGLASEGLACHLPIKPTSLTYYAVQGQANPLNQIITVYRSVSSTATLTASDNSSWLTVSPPSTTMTSSKDLTAAVNTSGRGAGTYKGTITIKVGTWCTYTAPVTLIISPAGGGGGGTTSSATLTWSAVTGATVSGYKVYVGDAPSRWLQTINVGTVTRYTVSNLTVGKAYYFAVSAYNSAGEGPTSTPPVIHTIQ